MGCIFCTDLIALRFQTLLCPTCRLSISDIDRRPSDVPLSVSMESSFSEDDMMFLDRAKGSNPADLS